MWNQARLSFLSWAMDVAAGAQSTSSCHPQNYRYRGPLASPFLLASAQFRFLNPPSYFPTWRLVSVLFGLVPVIVFLFVCWEIVRGKIKFDFLNLGDYLAIRWVSKHKSKPLLHPTLYSYDFFFFFQLEHNSLFGCSEK